MQHDLQLGPGAGALLQGGVENDTTYDGAGEYLVTLQVQDSVHEAQVDQVLVIVK